MKNKRKLSDDAYMLASNLAMATDCGFREAFLEHKYTVIREHAIATLKEVIADLEAENNAVQKIADDGMDALEVEDGWIGNEVNAKVYKSVYSPAGDDMGEDDHMLNLTPKLGEGLETTLQELIKLENHQWH